MFQEDEFNEQSENESMASFEEMFEAPPSKKKREDQKSSQEEVVFATVDIKTELLESTEQHSPSAHLQNYCCLCLAQENLSAANINQLLFYEQFVEDGLRGFKYESLRICTKCSKLTETVMDFKRTCSESLKALEKMGKSNVEASAVTEIESVLVKTEPDLDDAFQTKIEPDPITEYYSSGRPKRNVKKIKVTDWEEPEPKASSSRKTTKSLLLSKSYCSYCGHFFPEALENHYARIHGVLKKNNSWACKTCKKKIGTKEAFLKHFDATHIRFAKPQKCPQCDEYFKYREPYKMHVGKHNNEFQCEYCKQRFYQLRLMRRHVETKHLGLKRCKQCRQAFATEEDLKKHLVEEKLVRMQNTCEHCKRTFSDKHSLKKHQSSSQW